MSAPATNEVGTKRAIGQDDSEVNKKLKASPAKAAGNWDAPPVTGAAPAAAAPAAAGDTGAPTDTMFVRVLCESKVVGGIIGKGGSVIKQMREMSGAWLDVADAVPNARKRIVTVKGNVDAVANGIHLMADRIAANSAQYNAPQGETPSGDLTVIVDLLIPQCQIGGVIGKGGAKIKVTRESSGATVNISEECLPDSTEKTCSIKGTSEQVYKAAILVCYHLLENAEKTARQLYWPKPDMGQGAQGAYGQQQAYGQQSAFAGGMGQMGYGQQQQQQFAGYGGQQPQPGFGGYGQQAGQQGEQENVVIPIPDTLIGFVIGRAGSIIKAIRQRSGSKVKINDKQAGATERIVTITGSRQGNEMAVALINEQLQQSDVSFAQA